MTRRLKIHWAIWTALTVFVFVHVILFNLSDSTHLSIRLSPNGTVELPIFRPYPHPLSLYLYFERMEGQERPELGTSDGGTDWQKTGFLDLRNPGEPIRLRVQGGDREVIYEVLPAGSNSARRIGRDLVPFVDDGNPNRIPWPPNLALRPTVLSGHSVLTFSVIEVGERLAGEQATLIVESPIAFKFMPSPGYSLLWWFMLWPGFAFLLAVYWAVLLWKSIRTTTGPNPSYMDSPTSARN